MIRRVRMARKRLAIARERGWAAYDCFIYHRRRHRLWRYQRRKLTLRAIERRKDRIA